MSISHPLKAALATLALVTVTVQAGDRTVIQNKGSDTLVNVAQAWAEHYRDTVDIANASRKMKSKEVAAARKKGQNPVEHVVGYDALAVYIHHDNPAKSLSFEQLKDVYIRGGKATKWSNIGLTVPGCTSDRIVVVSRQNNSGTYAYFKKAVLGKKGKFRQGTLDMHGSKDVVDLVEKTPCAIGYSGLAYATDHVKMACISKKTDDTCINPSVATASDRSYPIARPLFMYTNGEPTGEIGAYLDWVKSDEGQCILLKKGYAPVRNVTCG